MLSLHEQQIIKKPHVSTIEEPMEDEFMIPKWHLSTSNYLKYYSENILIFKQELDEQRRGNTEESVGNKYNDDILKSINLSLDTINSLKKQYSVLCKSDKDAFNNNRESMNALITVFGEILLPGNPMCEPEALFVSIGGFLFFGVFALLSLSVPILPIVTGAVAAVSLMIFIVNVFGIHMPYSHARSLYNLTEAIKSEVTLVEKLQELSHDEFKSKIEDASQLDTAECISLTQLALNIKTSKPYQAAMYKLSYSAGQLFNPKRLYESRDVSVQRNELESLAFNVAESSR